MHKFSLVCLVSVLALLAFFLPQPEKYVRPSGYLRGDVAVKFLFRLAAEKTFADPATVVKKNRLVSMLDFARIVREEATEAYLHNLAGRKCQEPQPVGDKKHLLNLPD